MIAPKSTELLNVLVADDDPIARDMLQIYLESIGCRVQAVNDGDAAYKVCEERADELELVVLDARMPGPCPRALYDKLRALCPSLPILYCSGVSPEDPEMHFINEHGLSLLPKPFNRTDLLKAMRRVLTAAESARSIRGNYGAPRADRRSKQSEPAPQPQEEPQER